MIKYYRPYISNYQYGKIWSYIDEYYLIKEGWMECVHYRENPNDPYYISDRHYTREDFIKKREVFKDEEMFESLEKAKEELKKKLDEFYKKESLTLLKAYLEVIKEL